MKVLVVHNTYQRPGGEDVVFEQETRLLERRGHTVITYKRSNWEIDGYSGLRRASLVKQIVWSTETLQDFSRLLEQHKPDIVHVHNTFAMISPSIYSACRAAHVPVVQTLHNYRLFCPAATFFRNGQVCEECVDHGLWRGVMHGCYRDSRSATAAVALLLAVHRQRHTWNTEVTRYIALSEFSRRTFERSGLPPDKICVKPNFVYPDPGSNSSDLGEHVLFIGRLSPEKRVGTVLHAWTRLLSSIPLLVIGGGPERQHLETQVRTLGLSNITFRGQQPREEIVAALRRARFLVFSSEWYENFPVTLAESFACGVPVICSRLGAMQEIVHDGYTGLHFTPGDPHDLAKKVEWAWNHPNEMKIMGRQARLEFEKKYTADENYIRLKRIYDSAISDMQNTPQSDTMPR